MKKSATFLADENVEPFDPHVDFSRFLEEAKMHGRNLKSEETSMQQSSVAGGGKKSKSNWLKNSLFFWRKSIPSKSQHVSVPHVHNPTRPKAVSGPIHEHGERAVLSCRRSNHASGPLAGFINPSNATRDEFEVPYICLNQLNQPADKARTFGPIYLVT